MVQKLKIDKKLLDQIFAEVLRRYPHEACGFLLGTINRERSAKEFFVGKNIQNELHEKDPKRYPRLSTMAYVIDPEDQKKAEERAGLLGLNIIAIVHSHPDHEVYFSDEDKQNAAPWGEPLFSDVSYVVVSVYDKTIKAASDFFWDEKLKDFVEEKIL